MPERVLITGITGFVGSHLADYALGREVELYGTQRWHLSRRDHVRHIEDRINWIDCDITDPISVHQLLDQVAPDRIFHCAAESFVSPSWLHPNRYMSVNYNGTLNFLDALKQANAKTPFHIPGSGEEYGLIREAELPITEETVLRPVNPYAVSKVAQDLIGYVYHQSYGINVIRTRTFNHEGPRREKVFGIPWYAYQIAMAEAGLGDKELRVGHIDDRRNFTHVGDIVEAYWLATEVCEAGELYLIGSEDTASVHTFRDCLEQLIAMSTTDGLSYRIDPEFVRPTQVPFLIADTAKFRAVSDWQPKIPFARILGDTLDYWRERVAAGTA